MNRVLFAALLALCFSPVACAHLGHAAIGDLVADSDSDLHSRAGQKIDGYTKTDDIYYQYHGYVRLDGADSLRFSPVEFELEGKNEDPPPPGQDRFTLGVSEVKSLNLD
ncbi:MAG TPA: hypothetical protein VFP58_01295 [Candidatus Eisenbacteria bacterium]|nr:hypothetical protein [Candidatus Eisenbacteria bacterium]